MGIAAGITASRTTDFSSREALESIQRKAQSCLEAIRACIAVNTGPTASGPTILRNIAAELGSLPTATALRRQIVIDPAADDGAALAVESANALRTIGSEALRNVDRHSCGKSVRFSFDQIDGEIRLLIEDDEQGLSMDRLTQLLGQPGHLGLRRMRDVANRVGGTCKFENLSQGGLRVFVRIPIVLSGPLMT